jgi:hydroxymethylbilane synthase
VKKIRIATRGSHLALAQAKYVEEQLLNLGYNTEIVIIKTTGDVNYASFSEIAKKGDETKGLFTKEIEEALIHGSADIAVHSLKDLPTKSPDELMIAALPQRLDFRDYWIFLKSKKYQENFPYIHHDGKVGTSSFRRKSLLKYLCPSLNFIDIRGNVPTRIKKLFQEEGPDAILLSGAGIERLSLQNDWIEKEFLDNIEIIPLDPEWFPPAPGQGTLAVQCRKDDLEIINALKKIHNQEVEDIISIERGILSRLEGGCHLPLGTYAKFNKQNNIYQLKVFVGKDYPYSKKQKNFYINRFHKSKEKLVDFVYDELTKDLPIVVFGKKQKNDVLKNKFINHNIYFVNIIDTKYYDNFIINIINKTNLNNNINIYTIFSAEGIRSLKNINHSFNSNDVIFLNGKKSLEVFNTTFPENKDNRIILSDDGTALGIAKKIELNFSPSEVKIISVTAKESQKEFFDFLKEKNYCIEQWIGYETQTRILEKNEIDSLPKKAYFIFGSPSIFDAFYRSLNHHQTELKNFVEEGRFICLGKTTFQHILNCGIPVYAVAQEPDYEMVINEFL